VITSLLPPLRIERQRGPDLRHAPRGTESLRKDAHHGERLSVDPDVAAHQLTLSAEAPLPEGVAEHHHLVLPRDPVLRNQEPAQIGRGAHHVEEVRGHSLSPHPLRVSLSGDGGRAGEKDPDGLKGLIPFLVGPDIPRRECVSLPPQVQLPLEEEHQLIGLRVRKRAQQHPVQNAEESRVPPDAQRQGHHYDGGESRLLDHEARGVSRVLPEPRQGAAPAGARGAPVGRSTTPGSQRAVEPFRYGGAERVPSCGEEEGQGGEEPAVLPLMAQNLIVIA
jgi:hypothetical protein